MQKVPGFSALATFTEFLNAFTTVKSRFFNKNNGHDPTVGNVMVPFGDFVNHDTPPNANWLFGVRDSSVSLKGLAKGNDEYNQGWALYASGPIVRGEQITASYGEIPDDELLMSYGFVLPDEAAEPMVLQYDLQVNANDPLIDLKKSILKDTRVRFSNFGQDYKVST